MVPWFPFRFEAAASGVLANLVESPATTCLTAVAASATELDQERPAVDLDDVRRSRISTQSTRAYCRCGLVEHPLIARSESQWKKFVHPNLDLSSFAHSTTAQQFSSSGAHACHRPVPIAEPIAPFVCAIEDCPCVSPKSFGSDVWIYRGAIERADITCALPEGLVTLRDRANGAIGQGSTRG